MNYDKLKEVLQACLNILKDTPFKSTSIEAALKEPQFFIRAATERAFAYDLKGSSVDTLKKYLAKQQKASIVAKPLFEEY